MTLLRQALLYYLVLYLLSRFFKTTSDFLIASVIASAPCILTIRESDPDYTLKTMIKMLLVTGGSLAYLSPAPRLQRVFLFLNVACLLFTKPKASIALSLVALSFLTPKDVSRPGDLYIGFFVIVMTSYYLHHKGFKEHIYLHIGNLLFPLLLHLFARESYFEWRLCCLQALFVFDRFDKKNSGL